MENDIHGYSKIEAEIEFTTPCLAAAFDHIADRFTFQRDAYGNIVFSVSYWRCMLRDALKQCMPESLSLLDEIKPATLHRSQTIVTVIQNASRGYEALPEKSRLTIQFLVPDAIDAKKFGDLLRHAGEWIGFSPAKSHMGYGRFRLLSCQEISI